MKSFSDEGLIRVEAQGPNIGWVIGVSVSSVGEPER